MDVWRGVARVAVGVLVASGLVLIGVVVVRLVLDLEIQDAETDARAITGSRPGISLEEAVREYQVELPVGASDVRFFYDSYVDSTLLLEFKSPCAGQVAWAEQRGFGFKEKDELGISFDDSRVRWKLRADARFAEGRLERRNIERALALQSTEVHGTCQAYLIGYSM